VNISFHWLRLAIIGLLALNLWAQSDAASGEAKRERAYRTLDALQAAIQSASKAGLDTSGVNSQAAELKAQLGRAVDDSETDDVTSKAARLIRQISKSEATAGASATAVKKNKPAAAKNVDSAARHEPPPLPVDDPEPARQDSSHTDWSLILSVLAILVSIGSLVVGPMLCKAAIEKALKSAGLQ
jgi:hypothetical protein